MCEAERLKLVRKEWGATQESMALLLGIPRSTYTKYEQGLLRVSDEARTLLFKKRVNLIWLLMGEGEMFLPSEEEKKAITKPSLGYLEEVLASKEELEEVKKENQTLQEKVARLESLEQTKLQRENCVLHGKVGELEKRLEALENLAASYLRNDKMA